MVVAAIHGYGAAWLAIRMLFRPRYPVKLAGLTVWPQGMVPRHQDRLAAAIGSAVGNELVSQETVISALFEADFFRRKVSAFVTSYTTELLETSYPSIIESLPSAARIPVLDGISALQIHLAAYVTEMLRGEELVAAVGEFISSRIDDLLSRRLGEIAPEQVFADVINFIEERLRGIVSAPDFRSKLRAFVSSRIDEITASKATLAEVITPETTELIKGRIDREVPPVVKRLAEIATSRQTRTQIGALIKREVDDYYGQLSFFKKIFVSRAKIHGEVDELMNKTLPRRIEEYLHGEAFEQQAKEFLDGAIEGMLSKPLNVLIGQIAPDRLQMVKDQVSERLLHLAQSPELTNTFRNYAQEALGRLRPRTLKALAQRLRPDSAARLKKILGAGLLNLLTREETIRMLNAILSEQIDRLLSAPIGKPADFLPAASVVSASEALAEKITVAARERLPAAIAEFDIGGIVRRKVSEYPVEKLENLVLSVAEHHLKTIEIFGLVMGAGIGLIIGAGQIIYFNYIGRGLH